MFLDSVELKKLAAAAEAAEQTQGELIKQIGVVEKELQALRSLVEGGKARGQQGRGRGRKAAGGAAGAAQGADTPAEGTAPYKLVQAMSATTPMQTADIAAKVGLKEGTIKVYIGKFKCFKSAGRGKGYICTASQSYEIPETERASEKAMRLAAEETEAGGKKASKKKASKKKTQ